MGTVSAKGTPGGYWARFSWTLSIRKAARDAVTNTEDGREDGRRRSFTILEDGQDGQDGSSPTLSVYVVRV